MQPGIIAGDEVTTLNHVYFTYLYILFFTVSTRLCLGISDFSLLIRCIGLNGKVASTLYCDGVICLHDCQSARSSHVLLKRSDASFISYVWCLSLVCLCFSLRHKQLVELLKHTIQDVGVTFS